jgi:hypothetical protein
MRGAGSLLGLTAGIGIGAVAAMFSLGSPKPLGAASNDRFGDYVMATGAVSINPRVQTDGVWMLDYRSGKLLGTVIDKTQGKIVGWAEVDLTGEFGVKAFQDVHFMMTTGYVTQGQSALYVAETSTGKFGVYTMGPGVNGQGIVIRRHDMTSFRTVTEPPANPPGAAGAPGAPPAAVAPVGLPPAVGAELPAPGAAGMPATVKPPALPNTPLNAGTPTGPLPTTPPPGSTTTNSNTAVPPITIPSIPPPVTPPKN